MEKIQTIFQRERQGARGPMVVVPKPEFDLDYLGTRARPTEMLDGTNVRFTVRGHVIVRTEARMNPTKAQKTAFDIHEPWYREVWVWGQEGVKPQDQYIAEATMNTSVLNVPDGEWAAEAVGPKIQGNPLGLSAHTCFFFDQRLPPETPRVPALVGVPVWQGDDERFYNELCVYLHEASSAINPNVTPEGIVWHDAAGFAGKIKRKDFPHWEGRKNHGVIEAPSTRR